MKKFLFVGLIILFSLIMSCGQSGPLYLPAPQPAAQPQAK